MSYLRVEILFRYSGQRAEEASSSFRDLEKQCDYFNDIRRDLDALGLRSTLVSGVRFEHPLPSDRRTVVCWWKTTLNSVRAFSL